ncbi:recombinase family protein [Streptomyces sp. NPDC055243]|uniref:recombinase family protein n=1 Tax=Streptomyces sp. NPDC055243 TaxID=3365720 RepID=UPI0037D3E2B5
MAVQRSRKPRRAGGYVRISDDPFEQEKGVTRQTEDVQALATQLGWTVSKIYPENDTSAYRKKRIRLPNGRSVWRVIRPEFRQMLKDYEDGVIDGIIVYDLDRLARQPRDLEDLIDLVDHFKRPVSGVTGSLDLMTENGKAMARVLVAMANKSSADTGRRVARERLQRALEGRGLPPNRPFGWQEDRVTLNPQEAAVLRSAILAFIGGETWASAARLIIDSGISPVGGKNWHLKSIKRMMTAPRIAGIASYSGDLHLSMAPGEEASDHPEDAPETAEGGDVHAPPSVKELALRDAEGSYIQGQWEAIVTVDEWESLIAEMERRHEGVEFTSEGTRKYLLSGLLRCARPGEDGTPCNQRMTGIALKASKRNRARTVYKCPTPANGGCGNSQRDMVELDRLIEDLLFKHLEENRPPESERIPEPQQVSPEAAKLEDVQSRLSMMRTGMREGTTSPESFFAIVPGLETQERKLLASVGKARRVQADRAQRSKSPARVRAEWHDATVQGKRTLLGQYLRAIIVHPSQSRGRAAFDHTTIAPVWKPMPK